MGMCRSRAGRPASIGDPGHPRSHSPGPRLEALERRVGAALFGVEPLPVLPLANAPDLPWSGVAVHSTPPTRAHPMRTLNARSRVDAGMRHGPAGVWTSGVEAIDGPSTATAPVRTVTHWLPPVADCDCSSPCWRGRVEDSILSLGRRGTQAVRCQAIAPARRPTSRQLLVDRRSAQRHVSGALEPNGMTIGVVHFAVPVAPESVDGCEVTVVSRAGQCCVHVIDFETS